MLNGKSILITGGTGKFWQCYNITFVKKLPKNKETSYFFSRDENKQFEMSKIFFYIKI